MKLKPKTKCVVCDQPIYRGEAWEASKPKGRPTVYVHSDCIKRKERKT